MCWIGTESVDNEVKTVYDFMILCTSKGTEK